MSIPPCASFGDHDVLEVWPQPCFWFSSFAQSRKCRVALSVFLFRLYILNEMLSRFLWWTPTRLGLELFEPSRFCLSIGTVSVRMLRLVRAKRAAMVSCRHAARGEVLSISTNCSVERVVPILLPLDASVKTWSPDDTEALLFALVLLSGLSCSCGQVQFIR